MSSISVSNILPSRTRSGRVTVERPWTPERRSPSVPVMPTTPTKPRAKVNAEPISTRSFQWYKSGEKYYKWYKSRAKVNAEPCAKVNAEPRAKVNAEPRAKVNTQALDVLCRASIYVNLLGQAKELYLQQVEYMRDMKGREKKFELMNAYETLHRRVNDLIVLSGKQATLQEVENYSELVGWLARMSVFNQLVSVV